MPMPNSDTAAPAADSAVSSPCIGVCEIDAASGLCRGCLRRGDEIAVWRDASDDHRRAILRRIDERRRDGAG